MLLVIKHFNPCLAGVLGIVAALAFLAIGISTSRTLMVALAGISLAISAARTAHMLRHSTPPTRS
jgi:hypothetical protein